MYQDMKIHQGFGKCQKSSGFFDLTVWPSGFFDLTYPYRGRTWKENFCERSEPKILEFQKYQISENSFPHVNGFFFLFFCSSVKYRQLNMKKIYSFVSVHRTRLSFLQCKSIKYCLSGIGSMHIDEFDCLRRVSVWGCNCDMINLN